MACTFQSFSGCSGKQQSPYCLPHDLWQPELKVPPRLSDHNHFFLSAAWALYQFQPSHSFCIAWDPETTMIHLDFCSFHPLTPFQKGMSLTGADFLGFRFCTLVLYHFLVASLYSLPAPLCLSSDITPQIHDSAPPTLQKEIVFLLVEFQINFLAISGWIHGCSEWFARYPAKFEGPDERNQVPYSSAILPPF